MITRYLLNSYEKKASQTKIRSKSKINPKALLTSPNLPLRGTALEARAPSANGHPPAG